MQVPVVMPQLGLTMIEGMVSEWLKKPGEEIKKNELMFVVSTDKADMEVEATDDGILTKIVVEAGTTVPVGAVIAFLERAGEETAVDTGETPAVPAETIQPVSGQSVEAQNGGGRMVSSDARPRRDGAPASPRARRLAQELEIDIHSLQGSGPGARIVEEDIRKAAEASSKKTDGSDNHRRRVIAEKLTESARTIPHFSVSAELDVQQLMNLYESLKAQDKTPSASKITLTDLLFQTLAMALQSVPDANATWSEGAVRKNASIDLGLAIATEQGVVAPVLRNLEKMNLAEIVRKRKDLIERARSRRLTVTDLGGGVGTLTNLGMHGVDQFQAIITPGQSFILAVGRIRERPWVEKTLTVRPTVFINLSMDHRVADGVTAARLLTRISEIIEAPFNIVANLKELLSK